MAATLDGIRERGAITIGYVDGAAPFSHVGPDKQPGGYSVELCKQVAAGIRSQLSMPKLDIKWVRLTVQDKLDAVAKGRVDLECSTTTWTLGRQRHVDFSLITFVDVATVLANGKSELFRFADYEGKRIAAMRGTTTMDALKQSLAQRSMKATVVPVSTRAEGLELLKSGKVDGFASDRIVLIDLAIQDGGSLRLLDDDFSIEQYALALPRGDHDFRLAVNRVLARLYRTGEIMSIYDGSLGRLGRPGMLLQAMYFLQAISD
jgi:polar amino acid transport system substrate-binding protein/glutamate/aspartate transport system substrate-binding protein